MSFFLLYLAIGLVRGIYILIHRRDIWNRLKKSTDHAPVLGLILVICLFWPLTFYKC